MGVNSMEQEEDMYLSDRLSKLLDINECLSLLGFI